MFNLLKALQLFNISSSFGQYCICTPFEDWTNSLGQRFPILLLENHFPAEFSSDGEVKRSEPEKLSTQLYQKKVH